MTIHQSDFSELDRDVATAPSRRKSRGVAHLYKSCFKRGLDITLVVATAPITILLMAGIALLVLRDGGAPFYWQWRIGRNGRRFRLLKIRTMVPDAERRLSQHLAADAEAREEWETTQKLKRDPRVTKFGTLLRKSSLDELPQLWNVFMGSMSLIGPRPMMLEQKALYPGTAYFDLRPGITGLWQVSDRNDSSFADRAHFDTVYEQSLSLGNDLSILVRTIGVVVRGTGC